MKTFVISLLRSPKRRASIKKQLDKQNIPFEFFDAIDGHAEPEHPLFKNYNYTKRLWLSSGRMPSKGELGCYASHYLLWKKCVDLDETILIIEDDAKIAPSLYPLLSIIKINTTKYGLLRLEPETKKCTLYKVESNENHAIHFMDNNFGGTRSYSISPNSAKKLLESSKRWYMPVDNYIGSIYIHKVPSYLLSPPVVENPEEFDTTIQLGSEKKTPFYRKPTREFYSLYRKIRLKITNNQFIKNK